MFIVRADKDEAETKDIITKFQATLQDEFSGTNIVLNKDWDNLKKKLAYPIKKYGVNHHEGIYIVWDFEIDSKKIAGLESHIKLNTNIVRALIIRKDLI